MIFSQAYWRDSRRTSSVFENDSPSKDKRRKTTDLLMGNSRRLKWIAVSWLRRAFVMAVLCVQLNLWPSVSTVTVRGTVAAAIWRTFTIQSFCMLLGCYLSRVKLTRPGYTNGHRTATKPVIVLRRKYNDSMKNRKLHTRKTSDKHLRRNGDLWKCPKKRETIPLCTWASIQRLTVLGSSLKNFEDLYLNSA